VRVRGGAALLHTFLLALCCSVLRMFAECGQHGTRLAMQHAMEEAQLSFGVSEALRSGSGVGVQKKCESPLNKCYYPKGQCRRGRCRYQLQRCNAPGKCQWKIGWCKPRTGECQYQCQWWKKGCPRYCKRHYLLPPRGL
jgi:hypothetical protein